MVYRLLPQVQKYYYKTNNSAKEIQSVALHSSRLNAFYENRYLTSGPRNSIHRAVNDIFVYPCCWSANKVKNDLLRYKQVNLVDIKLFIS